MNIKDLDFSIREDVKPIEDMTEEELEDVPASAGFWWSVDEGDADMFVELLADEKTRKACYEAFSVIDKLERVVEDYVNWI